MRLGELFPGSGHVFGLGLAKETADEKIWDYARDHGYTIVTADADFVNLAETRGGPPKIVHSENCNYRTAQAEALLRRSAILIAELDRSPRSVLSIRNT